MKLIQIVFDTDDIVADIRHILTCRVTYGRLYFLYFMALEICFPEKCLTTCFLHALTTVPVYMPTSLICGSVHINVMYTCIYIRI